MFKPSVESIIAPLAKIEAKLQKYVEKQSQEYVKNIDKISLLNDANAGILDAKSKAHSIQQKLYTLLS